MLESNQMAEIEEVEGIILVDKFYHIHGKISIADFATRTGVKLEDIGPESEWQKGSRFANLSKVEKVDSSEEITIPENEADAIAAKDKIQNIVSQFENKSK